MSTGTTMFQEEVNQSLLAGDQTRPFYEDGIYGPGTETTERGAAAYSRLYELVDKKLGRPATLEELGPASSLLAVKMIEADKRRSAA